jgi:acyl-CoA synthetase (AMP-forming)/AMP-acid ligase II
MLVRDIIRLNAQRFPNKTALVFKDTRFSYSQLNHRVNRLANALLGIGVTKGDRVAVLADNCSQYVETYLATGKGGMVIVPVNTALDTEAQSYVINDSGASTVIFGEKYLTPVDSMRPGLETVNNYIVIGKAPGVESYEGLVSRYSPDEPGVAIDEADTAWLMYTSGTTGPPKGVMISHRNLMADVTNTLLSCYPINRNDVHLDLLPMFHVGCLWHMKCHFYIGSTNVLLERPDPKLVLEAIERERVTTTALIPPMAVPIINYPDIEKYDVSSMRLIIYAGAPMPAAMTKRMNEIFGDIAMQVFALTEGTGGLIMPPLLEGPWEKVKRPGSCGKETINVEVRLVNEEGEECVPGEIGEVLVRGDVIMKGYWNMPEATAKTLEGGYLHTGDLATRDEEGYYYITGRKKDTITSAGRPVYSPEIEDVISIHPSVAEVAVIGVPDDELGEAVKAVVVLKAGEKATESEIISWCTGKLDDYKVPRSVELVAILPKTPTGKVLKSVLRDRYSRKASA